MTFLQHLGHTLKTILHIGEVIAVAAKPEIAAFFPAIYPLYTSAIGLATAAEATASAATGTGPQKLAQLKAGLLPLAKQFALDNGLNWPEDEIQKWASAVVDTVNLIPGPEPAPAA